MVEPAWPLERELKGLFQSAQQSLGVQSQENSKLTGSSLDEINQIKKPRQRMLQASCCPPTNHNLWERIFVNTREERGRCIFCVPSSPQAPATSIPGYTQLICFGELRTLPTQPEHERLLQMSMHPLISLTIISQIKPTLKYLVILPRNRKFKFLHEPSGNDWQNGEFTPQLSGKVRPPMYETRSWFSKLFA